MGDSGISIANGRWRLEMVRVKARDASDMECSPRRKARCHRFLKYQNCPSLIPSVLGGPHTPPPRPIP
ncbi:uncharacterized protein G2W53_017298 [Senna tora]|uniref:Uncharacterized protein n=1 Tax=Senna tora TaxID=362788 RepID=A0A834TQY9_9FABA|nr:uncharacterized protein G2W53_017298 [Senna tora]